MKRNGLTLGKKYRFHPFEAVVLLLLAVYSVAVLGLLLWGFLASFRTDRAVAAAPWNLFSGLTFDNYMEVFENFKTFKYVDGGTKTVYFEEIPQLTALRRGRLADADPLHGHRGLLHRQI